MEKKEELRHVDFVGYLIGKSKADNDWLVEKLADFNEENIRLLARVQELQNSLLK